MLLYLHFFGLSAILFTTGGDIMDFLAEYLKLLNHDNVRHVEEKLFTFCQLLDAYPAEGRELAWERLST